MSVEIFFGYEFPRRGATVAIEQPNGVSLLTTLVRIFVDDEAQDDDTIGWDLYAINKTTKQYKGSLSNFKSAKEFVDACRELEDVQFVLERADKDALVSASTSTPSSTSSTPQRSQSPVLAETLPHSSSSPRRKNLRQVFGDAQSFENQDANTSIVIDEIRQSVHGAQRIDWKTHKKSIFIHRGRLTEIQEAQKPVDSYYFLFSDLLLRCKLNKQGGLDLVDSMNLESLLVTEAEEQLFAFNVTVLSGRKESIRKATKASALLGTEAAVVIADAPTLMRGHSMPGKLGGGRSRLLMDDDDDDDDDDSDVHDRSVAAAVARSKRRSEGTSSPELSSTTRMTGAADDDDVDSASEDENPLTIYIQRTKKTPMRAVRKLMQRSSSKLSISSASSAAATTAAAHDLSTSSTMTTTTMAPKTAEPTYEPWSMKALNAIDLPTAARECCICRLWLSGQAFALVNAAQLKHHAHSACCLCKSCGKALQTECFTAPPNDGDKLAFFCKACCIPITL